MDPPPPPPSAAVITDTLNASPRAKTTTESCDTSSVSKIKLMCSFGGHIVPRPHDKALCYMGGDTHIVVVYRNAPLSDLIQRLSKTLLNSKPYHFILKYQLPTEELDSLISVTTDEDLENMIEEYDRLSENSTGKSSRLRLFLFPVRFGSGSSIGSVIEGSIKSEDWFVNALNWSNAALFLNFNSSSVNSLLGLNDDVLVRNDAKVESGGVSKNQDVHSMPASLDRTISCESVSSDPNLPPLKVIMVEDQQQKWEVDEQFAQMGVNGNGNGNLKVDDGGVAPLTSPSAGLKVASAVVPVIMSSGQGGGDSVTGDEKSEHGGTAYERHVQQQQQAQLTSTQLLHKPSGGHDLASPDYVFSDGSITNSLALQKTMNCEDLTVQSRVVVKPVEQKIPDSRVQMQQHYQDSGYLMQTQYRAQNHPQLHQQQPQYIHTGSQYIQHLPAGAVPMPSYYPVYSSQQPQHSQHPGLEQQYPVYYVHARQPQAFNIPVQHTDYSEAVPSSRPRPVSSAAMAPPYAAIVPSVGQYNIARNANAPQSEVHVSLYKTVNAAAASVVQASSGQPQPQYVGFSQIHYPQSSAPTTATTTSRAYEYADPTQANVYYAQPLAPQMAQYQTMTYASPEPAAQLLTDNIKQQAKTSQS